jgi:hypothetical protein
MNRFGPIYAGAFVRVVPDHENEGAHNLPLDDLDMSDGPYASA